MKITTTEAIAILNKHLGISVEISHEDEVPEDWIINDKTSAGHPITLDKYTLIEVMYLTDGEESRKIGRAGDWCVFWNVNAPVHIVKYRIMK